MKKKILFVAVLLAIVSAIFIACDKDKIITIEPGPESGTYYCNADDGSKDLITLHNGNMFTLTVNYTTKAGTYSLENSTLTLSFLSKNDNEIVATLNNETISLDYEGDSLVFLKMVMRTVSFESNQGSPMPSIDVLNGETVSKPKTDPVRDGYIFVTWCEDVGLEDPFEFDSTPITKDLRLYASWAESVPGVNEFAISFDLNYDDSSPAPDSIMTIGGKLFNPHPLPTRQGYTFEGWWVSMMEDGNLLSYPVTSTTVFEEHTTVYALWQPIQSGSAKLNNPVFWIEENKIVWNPIENVLYYSISISHNGTVLHTNNIIPPTSSSYEYEFKNMGDYIISLGALGFSSANNSEIVQRSYRNLALKKVSIFNVIDSSILLYNPVPNATKYTISIECNNPLHNHTEVDNHSSTTYNFSNCDMKEGGIKFVIVASAEGFLSSESTFVYDRKLDKIADFAVDQNQNLRWTPVAYATSYEVTVKEGSTTFTTNIGNQNSFSLKSFGMGELGITVKPLSSGFNSSPSSVFTYNKTTIATPKNLGLDGFTVQWEPVVNATNYTIRIGGLTLTCTSTEGNHTLSQDEITALLDIEGDYTLSIRANGTSPSLYSDEVCVGNDLSLDLTYFEG